MDKLVISTEAQRSGEIAAFTIVRITSETCTTPGSATRR
jgi:hypothetical protein